MGKSKLIQSMRKRDTADRDVQIVGDGEIGEA